MINVLDKIIKFNHLTPILDLRITSGRYNCNCLPCQLTCDDCIFDIEYDHPYNWVCDTWGDNQVNKIRFAKDSDFFTRIIE